MSIAVTGASGQLGRLVAVGLLDAVDPSEVVLLTRSPDALADLAERGATVRHADFDDPDGLVDAFAGVERMLLISTDMVGSRLDGHRAAIAAAAKAGVTHVAYTSISRPDPANPAGVVPDHAATEEALRDSGVAWTMLRNNLYADMQPQTIGQAAESGSFVTNTGDGATAYVTRADCAAAAVAVLTGSGHENKAYEISGPEALTATDVAALASEIAGRPVEVVLVDDEAYIQGMVDSGLPRPIAGLLASFGTATREGWTGEVSDTVETLTGRAPTPLRDVVLG
ncbi:MAG: SDR family oxidoreductase [Actinomycetota bacterium]|nr:SDR family oxidoreductase [Actinomycetota bacterium]